MALPKFIYGGTSGVSSPEELQRLREIAASLAAPRAPRNIGEGLSAIGDALGYRLTEGKADRMSAEGAKSAQSAIAKALGGAGAFPAAPAPSGGAPIASSGQPNYRDAIASIESKGSGDYSAIGPTNPKLGRALGRYQVMEANIGPWSRAALGKEVTPEEFLASPQIQDAIFDHQFGSYIQKYGNANDAASAWFTGQPLSKGANRRDVLGTSGAGYVKKFAQALNGPSSVPSAAQVQVASLDPSVGAGAGTAPDPYGQIPELDSRGEDQRAKFKQWNSDPVANEATNEASIDPALAGVIQRAKQIAGTDFVIGSGKRDAATQQKAVDWGWSKTNESDHLGGGAADLWPIVNGQVVFDPQKQAAIVQAMKQAAKEKGVDIEAGADWKRFKDTPHFGMLGQTPMEGPIPPQRPGNPVAQALVNPQPQPPARQSIVAALNPQPGPVPGTPAASTPAGQRVVQQMVNPQPMSGGAPLPMMGMPQQAPPQLQQPVSDPQQQVAQNLPVMAGGNSDAIPKGQPPSVQDLMQAAQNPWLNDGQRAMVNMLLKQQLDQADPNNALDAEYKRAQIDALKAKPDQTPESVRALTLRAQAAGLKEGTPEYQQFMLSGGAPKAENKPSGIQEYEYAKSQGFPGTFQDWEASKKGGMSLTVDPATGQISFQQGSNIKPMTEAQSKDTTFATRAAGALPLLDKFGDALTSLPESTGGNVPVVGNYLKSPEYQQAEQAGKEFLQAILRKDTGAAITKEETAEYGSVYLPRPGDSPELLAQKKASRTRALEAMKAGMTPQAILAQEKAIAASGGAPAPEAPKKRLKFNPATGELE